MNWKEEVKSKHSMENEGKVARNNSWVIFNHILTK